MKVVEILCRPDSRCWAAVFLASFSVTGLSVLTSSAAAQQVALPPISITGSGQGEGSEAAGYKPATVSNLGPLGQTPILDTPYSVNVISAPLIENLQASRPDDLYRIDPVTQTISTTARGWSPNYVVRGFLVPNSSGRLEDGMALQNLFAIPLEDKERVEVYSGLTSFLFGPTNVGGLVNFVYKRPTAAPLANVTVGDYGGLSGFVHGDFGGPIDKDGRFAYRLNIVGQDGDTAVNFQSMRRDLVTLALTWNVMPNASITVIGSHHDQEENGVEAGWSAPTNPNGTLKIPYPAAPNPSQYYGQPFTSYATQRDRIGSDFNWKLNDIFTLRASYAYSQVTVRDNISTNNTLGLSDGTYTYNQGLLRLPNFHYFANSGYSFVDSNFDTGFIHHKVTTGFYGNDFRMVDSPTGYAAPSFNNLDFAAPSYFGEPAFTTSNVGPARTQSYNSVKNVVLDDNIKFNEQWSALVGANYTMLSARNFTTATGALTSSSDEAHLSPSASLIFKPLSWVSTYATYSESLQSGQFVQNSPGMVFTNNGQILSPYIGREYEVGAKANAGGLLLTASLFQIQQALQYAVYNNNNTYTYVQNGQQRNRGIELTATGNVFEGFRVLAGVTLIDPRVTQSNTSPTAPSITGKEATGVANQLEKITAEYDVPYIKGLTLTGGFYFTGQQAIDRLNSAYLPSFTTEDLGFRYRTSEFLGQPLPVGREFILRFDVENITNNHYWLTSNYVGAPRTFLASGEMKF